MNLKLRTITFFVEDMPKATDFYSNVLNLTPDDIRPGWSSYKVDRDFRIAFHRGKGRKPRLTFTTSGDLATVRESLNGEGARLGPVKDLGDGVLRCAGKDKDGNTIEIRTR